MKLESKYKSFLSWKWSVNLGSGNGLVPSGNKPLPEPMLTQITVTIGHNELTTPRRHHKAALHIELIRWNPDIFLWRPLPSNHNKYPCFYISARVEGSFDMHWFQNSRILFWSCNNSSIKMPVCPRFHIHRNHVYKFHPCQFVQYLSCRPFHIHSKETWLHERAMQIR